MADNIERNRGSLDSRRVTKHISRILILFSILLIISILFILIIVSHRKNFKQLDKPIKHDLFTPPALLA